MRKMSSDDAERLINQAFLAILGRNEGRRQTTQVQGPPLRRPAKRARRPLGRSAYGQGTLTPAGRRGHGQGGLERLLEPAGEGEDPKALAQSAAQPGGGLRSALRGVDGEGRLLVD